MSLLDLIAAELRTGLARLEGTHLSMVIPVRQGVIDELLPLIPAVPPAVAVALGQDRHLQVRYGSFHASARLHPEAVLDPSPIVTLTLSSQLVAFALARLTLPPFVRVSGREVRIHLAEIPALADVSGLWPHVEQIAFASVADRLDVSVRLRVRAGAPPLFLPRRLGTPSATAASTSSASPMGAWVQRQLDAGLPAFAGARASVSVRAPVGLLNDVLAGGLADAASGQPRPSGPARDRSPDVAMVARLIRHARLDAAPGVVTLDVEAGVDG